MASKKATVFFEAGKWYHRVKTLQEDGTTKYSKKGGFDTAKEAEASGRQYEEEYKRAYRTFHASSATDFDLKDYLIFWLEDIYSARIENTTKMVASYVLYDLIIPSMEQGIRLRYVNVEYLDALLKTVAQISESAGNKSRELLNIALKDAVEQGYLHRNPVPDTKPYKRKKPTIVVLSKEKMRFFLEKASESPWYMEIMICLFLGLRKGELSGLKYSDINIENRTMRISRQVTSDPIMEDGSSQILKHQLVEKDPKTENSFRTLRIPEPIMEEILERKRQNDLRREQLGDKYVDRDYLSCAENGLPHSASAFNKALNNLCSKNGLPHLTPHGLRHMYATILTEQGVPLVKVSALLGHASIHTTFEYYCEVMDERERIISFMNNTFIPEGENDD